MPQPLLQLSHAIARNPAYRLNNEINLSLLPGEHWAIVGPNGAGKNMLMEMMIGKNPLLFGNAVSYNSPLSHETRYVSESIRCITFKDRFGDENGSYYYQQRWNSQDAAESPRVGDLFPHLHENELQDHLIEQFSLTPLLGKRLVQLSSGEYRKMQILTALGGSPSLLVLDNPFIGLDATSTLTLTRFLSWIASSTSLTLLLLLSREGDIPSFVTHVIPVVDMECRGKIERSQFRMRDFIGEEADATSPLEEILRALPAPTSGVEEEGGEVIAMRDVHIAYEGHTLLNLPLWQVRCGDKWAITGPNGSGKSTLLSLVCADNPQAYACHISLFGRRRGTGESIWDIKKKIGFVSPEMHRAFLKDYTLFEIVASGLNDTLGLARRLTTDEEAVCHFWCNLFGLSALQSCSFLRLSSGEQRLALLARAFVKNPQLLILDEPFHGLDDRNVALARRIVEAYASLRGKTLLMVSHRMGDFPACITHHLQLGA